MPTVEQVLARHGILRPDVTIRAAAAAGLELAAACVVLMNESGGGKMIWGHDKVDTGGVYTKGGPVTRENYVRYRDLMRAGKIGRQGVGDCQLTSSEYQDRADALGGCWDPYANQRSGFTGLANLIRRYGTREGFRRYNGSGPTAEAYADKAMARLAQWRERLAEATPSTPTAAAAPAPTVPLTQEDPVQNIALPPGNHQLRLVCPVGTTSMAVARAWLSAVVAGSRPGKVKLFFQNDTTGLADATLDIPVADGRSARAWRELPDGTTVVTVQAEFPDGGALCLETLAKR